MNIQERVSLLRSGNTDSAFADVFDRRGEIRSEINRLTSEDQVLTDRLHMLASQAIASVCNSPDSIDSLVNKCTLSIKVNPETLQQVSPDSMLYRVDPTLAIGSGDGCTSLPGIFGYAFGARNWLHVCSDEPMKLIENHLAIRQALSLLSPSSSKVVARISILRHGADGYYSDVVAVYTYRSSSTGLFKPGSWTRYDLFRGDIGDDLIVDKIGPDSPIMGELSAFVDALSAALESKDEGSAYRD